MKKLFLAASGVFGAIPGLAVIASGLGAPPGTGYRFLFGGVIEAFGTLTLVILWVNQDKLRRFSKRRITRIAVIAGVLSFVFIATYVSLFRHTVVEHPRGTAYYPLWLSGDVEQMVTRAGSRESAIESYGIRGVVKAIDEMGSFPLTVTSILLLLVYQGVFTALTISFSVPGLHMKQPLLDGDAQTQIPTPPARAI